MLFTETVADYYENHAKHINALFGQTAGFCYVKEIDTYSSHWALKGETVGFVYRRKA
jgi:hypothetical protein